MRKIQLAPRILRVNKRSITIPNFDMSVKGFDWDKPIIITLSQETVQLCHECGQPPNSRGLTPWLESIKSYSAVEIAPKDYERTGCDVSRGICAPCFNKLRKRNHQGGIGI